MKKTILLTIALLFSSITHSANIFYFKSDPGDYIGSGQEIYLTDAEVDFTSDIYSWDNSVHFSINNFSRANPSTYNWWYANFSAPQGMPLTTGQYISANRWPFQDFDSPGLSVYGNGRGCNQLSGEFNILEVEYDQTGQISKFAVDFIQHCEFREAALAGSLRYNSDVAVDFSPKPKISIINGLNRNACVEATGPDGGTVNLVALNEDPNSTYTYSWYTPDGQSSIGESFDAKVPVDGHIVVELTALKAGETIPYRTSRVVCVSDTTPPAITIHSPVEGESYPGNSMKVVVEAVDLVDGPIKDVEVFSGVRSTLEINKNTGIGQGHILNPANTDVYIQVYAKDSRNNSSFKYINNIKTGRPAKQ
jgi:hypothetical protein